MTSWIAVKTIQPVFSYLAALTQISEPNTGESPIAKKDFALIHWFTKNVGTKYNLQQRFCLFAKTEFSNFG